MNRRLAQLYVRRERLLAQAAAQRDEVALLLAPSPARSRSPTAASPRPPICARIRSSC